MLVRRFRSRKLERGLRRSICARSASRSGLPEVRFAEQAELDLEDIYLRELRTRSPQGAREYVLDLRERCRLLADRPRVGRSVSRKHGFRTHSFDRLVTVLFVPHPNGALILRVLPRGANLRAAIRTTRP